MLTGRPGPAPPTHTAAPRTAVSSRKAAHLCQRRAVPCSAASTLEQAQAPAPTPARQPLDVGEVGWRTDFTNEYTAEGRVLGVGAFGKVRPRPISGMAGPAATPASSSSVNVFAPWICTGGAGAQQSQWPPSGNQIHAQGKLGKSDPCKALSKR